MSRHTLLLIFGPFRSGTSLTAALCNRLGADFGPRQAISPKPDRHNPTGYFQRRDVVTWNQLLLDSHDHDMRSGVLDPDSVPGVTASNSFADVDMAWTRESAIAGIKDPRFCFTLPIWLASPLLEEADVKLVRVRRKLEAVSRSAAKHRFVGQYCNHSQSEALEMSTAMDAGAESVCESSGLPSHVVDYDALVAEPLRECQALAAFIDGENASAATRAQKLVGKNNALLRHYSGKITRPDDVLEAVVKTIRAKLQRRPPF